MEAFTAPEGLKAASSIATFESTTTRIFQQDLRAQLSRLVASRQVHHDNAVNHYNSPEVVKALSLGFEWTVQCSYHDKNQVQDSDLAALTDQDLSATPLNELMKLLADPCVIPLVLSPCILQTLVQVILTFRPSSNATMSCKRRKTAERPVASQRANEIDHWIEVNEYLYYRSRWSPSQLLLLQSVIRIMVARQCCDDLGSIILTVFQEQWSGPPPLQGAQSLLSFIKYCVKQLEGVGRKGYSPVPSLFPCLWTLVQTILSPENNLIVQDRSDCNIIMCSSCGKYIDFSFLTAAQGRRKRQRMDVSSLQGEHPGDPLLGFATSPPARVLQHRARQPLVSLKSIMEARESSDPSCPYCQSKITLPDATDTKETKDWCRLRDKSIHTMIRWFQSTIQASKYKAFGVLRDTLTTTSVDSPFLRLCTLQLANIAGRDGYGYLLLSLWNLTWQLANPKFLAWYAEVIVESSFCDNRESCWDAMQPLINSIRSRYITAEDPQVTGNNDLPSKLLIPCLEYIIARRRNIFRVVDDSIKDEFHAFIQALSPFVADSTDSNHSTAANLKSDDKPVVHARESEDEDTTSTSASKSEPRWVDPEPLDLHLALQRVRWSPYGYAESCRIHKLDPKLLSNPDHDKGLGIAKEADNQSQRKCPPIMQCLSDDVMRTVLSFLGYKKLVRVRYVSKAWKEMADDDRYWFPLYRSRFGLRHDGSHGLRADGSFARGQDQTWKEYFMEKWIAQRDIRLDYTCRRQAVFKHRVCTYFGCFRVIRSQQQLARHYDLHRRKREKAQSAMR
ncbi:expressed unknown protein [Seminavis robusta]|uniref:F-box domain-containing protein n=1 Tax=Seminavis robusta TaxID=568900 RepID=A0A9N8HJL2_9STRA|nr:expressed unknown protein [Seminavis robusta]|eukprot:Sro773_g200430.1 n/a (789) ;mRNA; r:19930-22296